MRGSQPKFLFKAFTVRSALRLRLSPLTHVWTRKKPEQTERTASRAMLRSCAGHGARTVASPRTATPPHRGRRLHLLRPRSSAKKSPQETERGGGSANDGLAGALPSKTVLLRAGAVLFALGFVDAGYSGDWSRIGAISKDTEELLKLGAYAVVPLCLALALRVPGDGGGES